MQYKEEDSGNNKEKSSSEHQAMEHLGSYHFATATIPGSVSDLINSKSVGKVALFFLHGNIAKLFIYKKRIILTGLNAKVYDHDTRITIDHQVACLISMK